VTVRCSASHLSLLEHLARVPDPRKRRGVRHSLSSVLAAATSTGPLKAVTVAAGLAFPHAAQAICLTRRIRPLSGGKWRTVTVYAITSLVAHQATPAQLAAWIRGHWQIEALHHIRDVTYREDNSQVRTGSGLRVMAAIRNLVIAIMRLPGAVSIAATARHYATDATRPLATLGFIPT
jgi:predicted transposase YbfD/YdcC